LKEGWRCSRFAKFSVHSYSNTQLRRKEAKRGGGIRNYATSFALSLPKDIPQPNTSQWRKIAVEAIKAIALANNLDAREVWKNTCAVIHVENQKGKNNHLHLVVSNTHAGVFCKGITQRKTTLAVKKSFNLSVKKELKTDHRHYMAKNNNCRNKPLWAARAEKAELYEQAAELVKKYFSQLERWSNYIITKNKNRQKSTEKRLSKTAQDLVSLNIREAYLEDIESNIQKLETSLKTLLPDSSSPIKLRKKIRRQI
jgi:hypothetical protein